MSQRNIIAFAVAALPQPHRHLPQPHRPSHNHAGTSHNHANVSPCFGSQAIVRLTGAEPKYVTGTNSFCFQEKFILLPRERAPELLM